MIKRFGLLLALAAVPAMQGCFPLAVTGMGAAALVATDRRTTGIYIEDENIELKAIARLHSGFDGAHVSTTSFNRRVLLTGETPTEELRKRVEEAVREISNVKEVVNELQIAGASSYASRGNDALVTSNVKARLVTTNRVPANYVKVVTEQGVVYLMGLVTASEADIAVEIARSTSGVNRVVKVFEYIQ